MSSPVTLFHSDGPEYYKILFHRTGDFRVAYGYAGPFPADGQAFARLEDLPESIRARIQCLVEARQRSA